jgi:AcrR family transcriptional regulator
VALPLVALSQQTVLLSDSTSGPERIADSIKEQTGLSSARLSSVVAVQVAPPAKADARERILDAAYQLFSRRASRDVGVDEVIERAGVAKATLYRHFPSKDDLVIAFLERREERWTLAWVEAEARRRGTTPEEQLLAIFEVFDEWFQREDFEACSFINVLLEMGPAHPAGRASVQHLANIRTVVARLADEAALRDPESFARSWHILMKGSIVSATEGDAQAAQRAQFMARLLIEQHR